MSLPGVVDDEDFEEAIDLVDSLVDLIDHPPRNEVGDQHARELLARARRLVAANPRPRI